MKTCFRFDRGLFIGANYPLDSTVSDWGEALIRAGYFEQLRMPTKDDSLNSVATVYQHVGDKTDVPHFLISLWGDSSEIALLVVDDFNHLMATLAHIEPLTRYSTYLPD